MSPSAAAIEPAAVELPFKYIGGDPSIDLVNTVDWTSRGPEQDRLTDYARLLEWAEGAGVVPPRSAAALRARARSHPRQARAALENAVRVRAVLQRLFGGLSRGELVAEPLAEFNRILGEALEHLRIGRTDREGEAELRFRWDRLEGTFDGLLWPVIWSAASLLVSEESSRLQVCDGPDCGWMYVDRSRNGLRRWCQMETCGTREKTRRRYGKSQ